MALKAVLSLLSKSHIMLPANGDLTDVTLILALTGVGTHLFGIGGEIKAYGPKIEDCAGRPIPLV